MTRGKNAKAGGSASRHSVPDCRGLGHLFNILPAENSPFHDCGVCAHTSVNTHIHICVYVVKVALGAGKRQNT